MTKAQTSSLVDPVTTYLLSGEGTLPPSLAADADKAKRALDESDVASLAGLGPDIQLAVVGVLAERRNADTLRALEQATTHKPVRKAIGKALHLLKTKGVRVAEAPRSPGFQFHTVEGEEVRSYASLSDPEGDRMVWYGANVKGAGRTAFQAVIHETRGIGLFQTFPQMTAKIRRKILEELASKKIPLYEVSGDYARWLLEEGVRRNRASGAEVPKEYFESEPYLGTAPDWEGDPHPALTLLAAQGQASSPTHEEIRSAKNLFELEEVQPWIPVGEDADVLAHKIEEASGPTALVLDDIQRGELVQGTVEAASREYFTDERRALWRRRLLDLSQYLVDRGRPEARLAFAVAEGLAADDPEPAVRFFGGELFRRWVKIRAIEAKHAPHEGEDEAHAPEGEDEAGHGGSRLVTP